MISIIPSQDNLIKETQLLAKHWGFNYSEIIPKNSTSPFYLQLTPQHLELIQTGKNSPGSIFVDFTAGQVAHRRLYGGGKSQTIAKAIGINKISKPLILDATAGMGKDAFVFASLGARVIMMERSPISAALLSDGLQRAAHDDDIADIIQNISFIFGDARQLNTSIQLKEIPDIIYLDPMFPHRNKSAAIKKEMLAFQQLIGEDLDSDELLDICRKVAKQRVVVKRPIKAEFLNHTKPSYSMKMKKHRFYVYGCTSVVLGRTPEMTDIYGCEK